MIHCFTSFAFGYLAKARILARSIRRHHPDWWITAVISDQVPAGFSFNVDDEPFDDVLWADTIFGDASSSWIFKHDIVELCTAVKGPILDQLLQTGAEKLIYLDPDVAVFNSLQPMIDMLDEASILLTPHQLDPDDAESAIFDNEMGSLRHGIYNLGFLAIRNDDEGKRFARWWSNRLERFCFDDPDKGLFVDQKWCDLVPALFDGVRIIRDPGHNVASWNLSRRKLKIDRSGEITVNGSPLRFFHFTKLGPIGDLMTQRYAVDNIEVYELWAWYRWQIEQAAEPSIPEGWWAYRCFSNGVTIQKASRLLYRNRTDLQDAFPEPFDAGGDSYYRWLCDHGHIADAPDNQLAAK